MTSEAGPLPADWTLPALDPFNRAWFTSGELAVQECAECGLLQHPPEEICRACGSMAFGSTVLDGNGTVHSFTVVHHAIHASLEAFLPYVVVLVSLDAAPELRVVGNLLDVPADEVAIGMPVVATWQEHVGEDGETVLLPQWVRRAAEAPDR